MKQSCVSAFARVRRTVARPFALAAVALGLGAATLHAQGSTGKIEGRVRDQAGAPIPNATVTIPGTAFSATANPQGYWFINNVPAGTISLQAAFVGYKPVRVDGFKVLIGQTMTQNFTLEKTVVQVTEVTVTAATQPLVPRDEVTSKQRVDGEFTDKLPVDRVNQVLALQPGVVASASGNTLSIRGGRSDENATYIDGVPTQRGSRGGGFVDVGGPIGAGQELQIGTNGLEEASVTTGASSAEFGNAQSGIINQAVRTGSATGYNGSVGFETDEVFGKTTGIGYNRIQASFGGPLKLLNGLTFFVSGDVEGQKSNFGNFGAGINGKGSETVPLFVDAGQDTLVTNPDGSQVSVRQFAIGRGTCDAFANSTNPNIANNYGQSCNGIRSPNSSGSTYRVQGKLNYTYGTGSRVAVTLLGNQAQGHNFTYLSLYNPDNQFGQRAWNRTVIANWTQNLSKSAERALALDTYFSYQLDRFIQSPLNGFGPGTGTLGFYVKPYDFKYGFDQVSLDSTLVHNYILNIPHSRRGPTDFEDQAAVDALVPKNAIRNNAYGVNQFTESGGPNGRLQLYRENRTIGKATLDWQADRYNRIKLGGQFTKYHIENYSQQTASQAFSDVYINNPLAWNGFIEDRLDLGDVVLVGGLRYDFYDSRASRPYFVCTAAEATDAAKTTCGGVLNVGDTTRAFRTVSNPELDPNNLSSIFFRDKSHHYLSPRIQVAFPVTDKTNFRLSYAHQVEAPDFALVLGGINTDIGITNSNNVYGSDLDFGKTVTFEFGIRHAFSDDMVLDMSAYNKDNLANAAGRLVSFYDPLRTTKNDYRIMQNADFGNTRGIDVRLDRRFGNVFNGTLSYSFQQAKNTGSDPFTYINFGSRIINQVSGGNQPPPQAIAPTSNSRPHTLAAAASLNFPGDWKEGTALGSILQNFAVFATFRLSSGTPYTTCPDAGNEAVVSGGVCASGAFIELNTARLPSYKNLDLRVNKGLNLGGLNMTAYVDARNVLNFRNVLAVFVQTNDIVNAGNQRLQFAGDSSGYATQAKANGVFGTNDGSIDLTFGGAGASGCGSFKAANGRDPGVADCVYLIRAEQRYGNGDGVFTQQEQAAASQAFYLANGSGPNSFLGPGRRLRLGLEINF